jgi:hypothetical protein
LIDEEWLSGLRFTAANGVDITGLAGTGADAVVLKGVITEGPDKGQEVALKTYRHHLGYHIREIPPFLNPDPVYDMQVLNEKLASLVDEPGVDAMISSWDRLFSGLTKTIFDKGFDFLSVISLSSAFLLSDSLPLLAYSSPIRRRLLEMRSLAEDDDPFVRVNGPSFPIDGFRKQVKDRGTDLLTALDRGIAAPDGFNDLEKNPLFVWGGAAMEGFFDAAGEEAAVEYMSEVYGPFPRSPEAARLLDEADALANVYAYFFDKDEDREAVVRFTSLCAHAGLVFNAVGKTGETIANGMSLLLGES